MKYELDTTEILVVLASKIRRIDGEVSQCPVLGLCSSDGADLLASSVKSCKYLVVADIVIDVVALHVFLNHVSAGYTISTPDGPATEKDWFCCKANLQSTGMTVREMLTKEVRKAYARSRDQSSRAQR